MTINAWKTNFIGLNKPAKVLSGTAESFVSLDLWPYANGIDDPYWSGGVNPQFYRWQVTFQVNERLHGSHLTRTPFRFDAQDIEVGDFVAGAQDGKVCQIMSIISKTNSEVTAIVEDRLRYNTFRDPSGFGLFSTPGTVIFFQINELGYPMLDPVPGEAAADFASNVMSRFQYLNPLINYLLEKQDNGFEQGEAICIENEQFVLSNAENVSKFIGTVVHPGPGPHQFILRPANGVIDFVPNLPGGVGDYIYPSIDGSGGLTTSDASRRPIYMKVARAITSSTTGRGINPHGPNGDIIEFNRIQMTLQGTGNSFNLDDAIGIINNRTSEHFITASKVGAATIATSNSASLGSAYGIVAGYSPFSAMINDHLVTFTTTTSGSAAYGDATVADVNDMANDINQANIPDIIASVTDGSNLTLTNIAGHNITIVNAAADTNGNNFAGPSSVSSLPLLTSASSTTHALKLERLDGGPLTIRDIQGTFLSDAGVMSGQTGRYALGLNIEQGLRSSATTVVGTIGARDALHALVGDQCHVINDGNSEWALFVYDGSVWIKVSGQRSVAVDARTIKEVVALPGATSTIGTISEERRILNVSVTVLQALSNAPDFTVNVGSTIVWDFAKHGASEIGTYTVDSELITNAREDVIVHIPTNTASGQLQIEVTYV
ncbi:hypothetical protein UFOVP71_286 [uncultured Caudovirales phage]|uniref:Uncharacterized protein n=1 Tax=uncultured Caudovirales phage TaxID=2100421 RepID=A0A6J5T9Y4_9CAUD|nr:hypothetical protein UFOVP71_286 [uncultured Caudovirales phage]